ncbi:mRNA-capping enzyme-like isoform X2 [Artemia franciscana]|uniref:mRNA-capping enzyme-like isoform X2 n=1 Tax=Artemia franciscana TaxID=6661 RepID=UPI0032DB443D
MNRKRARYELRPPPRWLKCPRCCVETISNFIAFKNPLDERYDECVPPESKFTPKMLLDRARSFKIRDPLTANAQEAKIGLWIDLTKVEDGRRYDSAVIRKAGIQYRKIKCEGHQSAPTSEQYQEFKDVCDEFLDRNPSGAIAIHCTHGFNRTGFLIISYLVDVFGFQLEAAIQEFSSKRPPGIYKQDYLDELYKRWGNEDNAILSCPPLPDWCNEEEDDTPAVADRNIEPLREVPDAKRNRTVKVKNFEPPGVKRVEAVDGTEAIEVQNKIVELCNWKKRNTFPGAQPVSMTRENIKLLRDSNYAITWKADGTRYMMLIQEDKVYLADRDFAIFKVVAKFYSRGLEPLRDTLLDGEFVTDKSKEKGVDGRTIEVEIYNFLIYDIISYNGDNVGEQFFWERLDFIQKRIMDPREEAKRNKLIIKGKESFGIRKKEYFQLRKKEKVFKGGSFIRQVAHDTDGLIFQPVDEPYTFGQWNTLLKWKEPEHNSVDFRLKIVEERGLGMLPQKKGYLMVMESGKEVRFGLHHIDLKGQKELKEMNGKIIECRVVGGPNGPVWQFMRPRTDKSFPNASSTAESVLNSILYPVTEEDLRRFIDGLPEELKESGKPADQTQHRPQQQLK